MTTREMARCKDCAYLYEDENGNWRCGDWDKDIHNVSDEDCAVTSSGGL